MSQSDDWFPIDQDLHDRQVRGLLDILASDTPDPKHVLDLGCGDGRLLVPIVTAGHVGVGIDEDPAALDACLQRLVESDAGSVQMYLKPGDFTEDLRTLAGEGQFDLIMCLGHTWMLQHDTIDAFNLFRAIDALLKPHGQFVIDNFPAELWPCVAEGSWIDGVSPDATSQFVWADNDNVFTIREDDRVDLDDQTIKDDDTLNRLWTMGELELLAYAATEGRRRVVVDHETHLISFV